MKVSPRVKRVLLTLLIVFGVIVALSILSLTVVVGSAIAFSGSTGDAWESFLRSLIPIARFAAGAVAIGVLLP